MKEWSRRRVREMERLDLCGYVLKKGSPSCGMERVKVWNDNGQSTRDGRGLFAEELMLAMPALPVEEEGRLTDSRLRENFIERVFCFHRLKAFFGDRWTLGGLVEFHTAHKLLLLSHHEQGYRRMGRLVAGGRGMSRSQLEKEYSEGFMEILKHTATTRRHTNVLQHMLGHFRKDLDPVSRRETAAVVEDYRRGMIPLVVPMTLLRHHALRLEVEYLTRQVYLQPHPMELMLRNHV